MRIAKTPCSDCVVVDGIAHCDMNCGPAIGITPAQPSEPVSLLSESGATEHYKAEKRCCTVCDRKKTCHVCGQQTLYACSDCRIDFGVTIYVCANRKCQAAHELKCSARLREKLEALHGKQ